MWLGTEGDVVPWPGAEPFRQLLVAYVRPARIEVRGQDAPQGGELEDIEGVPVGVAPDREETAARVRTATPVSHGCGHKRDKSTLPYIRQLTDVLRCNLQQHS